MRRAELCAVGQLAATFGRQNDIVVNRGGGGVTESALSLRASCRTPAESGPLFTRSPCGRHAVNMVSISLVPRKTLTWDSLQ